MVLFCVMWMCALQKAEGKRLEYTVFPSQGPEIDGGGETERKRWEGKNENIKECSITTIDYWLVRIGFYSSWKDGEVSMNCSPFISSPQGEFSASATIFPMSSVNKVIDGFWFIWAELKDRNWVIPIRFVLPSSGLH